ncbi:DsrE/DsrF/DrsH-like family protein [Clostridium aminobutyricum]|uniref:DsrE/DsrF/DrsH-like family protein n=1 Tax=Clostridium aminobutyricum TaxID=33953 RepID=A0A939DAP0_CLOAM|nr:DsrE/DsrF/DrsH-like family protein [Clostridium aminobutyricum]MBN7774127.1 DsrE/DsrF/DrsH-like family protein [Clostridium aminobutyricum]
MEQKKVVIIGGVAGGATTAARLRRIDENIEIIIMEKGDYISYANCGLPYYIGDVIKEREALLLQTPQVMKKRFHIDVRIGNEVTSINKEEKSVTVRRNSTGEEYKESYDRLVISTGSAPLVPPISGIDGAGIFTLWNIPDTDQIKAFIAERKPKSAAVIGGGFIGLEMAENLKEAGCHVSIVEMQDQVMAPVDFEMAQLVHENIKMNGVELILSDGVKSFERIENADGNSKTKISLQSGRILEAELVILSIGIKPNSVLAKEAGLKLNARGGIVVDDYLKTSDSSIYAVGDVIEVTAFVEKDKTMIPLAGPANKQARICAGNIAVELGSATYDKEKYEGTQGTSVAKVFDVTVAATGLNEKAMKRMGKEPDKDYHVALINQKSHAGYYPGAAPITLKMLFTPSGKILGAQIVGQDGVDKRIDVIATVLRLGATVQDLKQLELAYAPPYSSAKDPVNMLGFVADNILKGMVKFVPWDGLEAVDEKETTVLDVTEVFERMAFILPGSYHIPLGELRDRLNELDKNKKIITYCAIGVRSYNAARILMMEGFEKVAVYPGGTSFYKSVFHEKLYGEATDGSQHTEAESGEIKEIPTQEERGTAVENVAIRKALDCSGLQCPGPIMKVFQAINEIEEGQLIEVAATDMGFARDIDAWCKRTGNTLVKTEQRNKQTVVFIRKGCCNVICGTPDIPVNTAPSELPQGKTMIVFSGDLDKVLASFIIANGAASMGRPVTMFFTFWGLNVLRRPEKQKVKKPFMDSMFGVMMPRGSSKLTLSNMNMGGMGTAMMKKVMKDKNVNSLEDLMKAAMTNGVKIVACTMSMDVMGLTKEELIDGIEYAGVAAYLGDAEQSNVNLFI